MNKIIGGLLVLSLLSRNSTIDVNKMAYDVFRTNQQIVYIIKKEDDSYEIDKSEISEMMNEIENGVQDLGDLLQAKNNIINKVQTVMDLKAYAGVRMTPHQIGWFNKFNTHLRENNKTLASLFSFLEEKNDIAFVQKEILHSDTNMELVYKKLKSIDSFQKRAIDCLQDFLSVGTRTLAVL